MRGGHTATPGLRATFGTSFDLRAFLVRLDAAGREERCDRHA